MASATTNRFDVEKINKTLPTTNIKGKEYVEVNTRILAFRKAYPEGSIVTDILSDRDGLVIMKASILIDGNVVATGHAFERESSSYINKTSHIENCETSAVGRALGMLGIGITTSIASAEEVANAINQQETPRKKATKEESAPVVLICERCGKPISAVGKFTSSDVAEQTRTKFGKQMCFACGKATKEEQAKAASTPTEKVVEEMGELPFPIDD